MTAVVASIQHPHAAQCWALVRIVQPGEEAIECLVYLQPAWLIDERAATGPLQPTDGPLAGMRIRETCDERAQRLILADAEALRQQVTIPLQPLQQLRYRGNKAVRPHCEQAREDRIGGKERRQPLRRAQRVVDVRQIPLSWRLAEKRAGLAPPPQLVGDSACGNGREARYQLPAEVGEHRGRDDRFPLPYPAPQTPQGNRYEWMKELRKRRNCVGVLQLVAHIAGVQSSRGSRGTQLLERNDRRRA
jgi:hypothetical protein